MSKKVFILLLFLVFISISFSIDKLKINETQTQFPYAFICLIDHSGSMETTDPQELRFKALDMLLERAEDKELFSQILFDSKTEQIVKLSDIGNNLEKLKKDIYDVRRPSGLTNYIAALDKGLEASEEAAETGFFPVILFFTDGQLYVSDDEDKNKKAFETLKSETVPKIVASKTPVIFVAIGDFKADTLINLSSISKYEDIVPYYEAEDSDQLMYTMDSIISNLRREKVLYKNFVMTDNETVKFDIPEKTYSLIIRLITDNEVVDFLLFDPADNKQDIKITNKDTFKEIQLNNPEPGEWKINVQNAKKAILNITTEGRIIAELITAGDFASTQKEISVESYLYDTENSTNLTVGKTIKISGKEFTIKKISSAFTVNDQVVDQTSTNNIIYSCKIPKKLTSQPGRLKIFNTFTVTTESENNIIEFEIKTGEKSIKVMDIPVLQIEISNDKPYRNQSVEIFCDTKGNKLVDKLNLMIEKNGQTREFEILWQNDMYKTTISFEEHGIYNIYPKFQSNALFNNAVIEVAVQKPDFIISKNTINVFGFYRNREGLIEIPYVKNVFDPDKSELNIQALESSFPGEIKYLIDDEKIQIEYLTENGASILDKILFRTKEAVVLISDKHKTADIKNERGEAQNKISINFIPPFPAFELSVLFALCTIFSFIGFKTVKARRLQKGDTLKLNKEYDCGKRKSSDIWVSSSKCPTNAFKIIYDGAVFKILSRNAKLIAVNGSLLKYGKKKELNPGDSISVGNKKKGNLLSIKVLEEKESKEVILKIKQIKHKANPFSFIMGAFSIITIINLFIWIIIQHFGI